MEKDIVKVPPRTKRLFTKMMYHLFGRGYGVKENVVHRYDFSFKNKNGIAIWRCPIAYLIFAMAHMAESQTNLLNKQLQQKHQDFLQTNMQFPFIPLISHSIFIFKDRLPIFKQRSCHEIHPTPDLFSTRTQHSAPAHPRGQRASRWQAVAGHFSKDPPLRRPQLMFTARFLVRFMILRWLQTW